MSASPASLRALATTLALAATALPLWAAKGDKFEKGEKIPKSERMEQRTERSSRSERAAEIRPVSSSTSGAASAAAVNGAGSQFDPFRIVVERNIFNPNRTGRTRSVEEPAQRVEQIALVGTMESESGGRVAFFDGDPSLQKPVRVGDTVAGYTVKEITPAGVELAGGEKTTPLRVNQQLRRVEGGEWRVTGRDFSRDVAQAGPAAAATAPAPTPAVPANASDVLRRLMEQRQKQLKQ